MKKQPDYPYHALKQGHEGIVSYKVEIGKYGSIKQIGLVKSSGYESLDTAALKAIKQSAFEPDDIFNPQESTAFITCGFQSRESYCKY